MFILKKNDALKPFQQPFYSFIEVFSLQMCQVLFLCIISLAVEGPRKEVMLGSGEILLLRSEHI